MINYYNEDILIIFLGFCEVYGVWVEEVCGYGGGDWLVCVKSDLVFGVVFGVGGVIMVVVIVRLLDLLFGVVVLFLLLLLLMVFRFDLEDWLMVGSWIWILFRLFWLELVFFCCKENEKINF